MCLKTVLNLSFVSKLIEKIVLDQLLSHLDQNNLWHTFQSAYRPKHSAETALLRVFNDLTVSDSVWLCLHADSSGSECCLRHYRSSDSP